MSETTMYISFLISSSLYNHLFLPILLQIGWHYWSVFHSVHWEFMNTCDVDSTSICKHHFLCCCKTSAFFCEATFTGSIFVLQLEDLEVWHIIWLLSWTREHSGWIELLLLSLFFLFLSWKYYSKMILGHRMLCVWYCLLQVNIFQGMLCEIMKTTHRNTD